MCLNNVNVKNKQGSVAFSLNKKKEYSPYKYTMTLIWSYKNATNYTTKKCKVIFKLNICDINYIDI